MAVEEVVEPLAVASAAIMTTVEVAATVTVTVIAMATATVTATATAMATVKTGTRGGMKGVRREVNVNSFPGSVNIKKTF